MMTVLSSFVEGDFFPKHPLALIARSVAFFGFKSKLTIKMRMYKKREMREKREGGKEGKAHREKERKRVRERLRLK